MREILFRSKAANREKGRSYRTSYKNGDWVYGLLTDTENYAGFAEMTNTNRVRGIEVDKNTVGQFTGLTDRNGKKIFEGDIGRFKQTDGAKRNGKSIICTGKVIYNAKTASYAVEGKDEAGCKYFDYFPIKDFEVIGNIHDNPELVEVNRYGN